MNWALLLPGYLVTGVAFGAFTLDLIVPRLSRTVLVYGAAAVMAVIAVFIILTNDGESSRFAGGILIFDNYSAFFFALFVVLAAVTILGSAQFVSSIDSPGEFVALLIMSAVGAMGMAAAGELITAYISLELLSFSLYILASYTWKERRTNEAGMKYILLGALASAFLLLGITYIYGLTGDTRYDQVAEGLSALSPSPGLIIALAMLTAGLGFKVAAVPFHMWTPDVYEGAPIPVTAYLAAASKAAGFCAADSARGRRAGAGRAVLGLGVHPVGRDEHDARQPGGHSPIQPQATDGVLEHRASWLSLTGNRGAWGR